MRNLKTLKSGRDFARVYRAGRRGRSDGVAVVARRCEGPAKVGMSIKASTGSAVARNRVRRRLRAIWTGLEVSDGHEVVIEVTGEALGLEYQELEKHMTSALAKAGAR